MLPADYISRDFRCRDGLSAALMWRVIGPALTAGAALSDLVEPIGQIADTLRGRCPILRVVAEPRTTRRASSRCTP